MLFILFKYLLSLRQRGGIVYMYNSVLAALQTFKCSLDDMFTSLGQYLDRYIVRDQVLLDQCTEEDKLSIGSCLICCLPNRIYDLSREFNR